MPHKEPIFAINPSRQSQVMKEVSRDSLDHQRKKVSHSGPLVHQPTWAKAGKRHNEPPTVSTRSNLSTLSGFVASRTVLPDDCREKSGPSQQVAEKTVVRPQISYNDFVSVGKQDDRRSSHRTADSPQEGNGKAMVRN